MEGTVRTAVPDHIVAVLVIDTAHGELTIAIDRHTYDDLFEQNGGPLPGARVRVTGEPLEETIELLEKSA